MSQIKNGEDSEPMKKTSIPVRNRTLTLLSKYVTKNMSYDDFLFNLFQNEDLMRDNLLEVSKELGLL